MSRVACLLLGVALSTARTVAADDYVPKVCPKAVAYQGGALHAPVAATALPDSGAVWAGELPDSLRLRLDGAVDWMLQNTKAPGITAAIGIPGEGVWQATRGVACTEPLTPLASEPYFYWGSVGKAFTAVVIMQLVQEGKLRNSDPLSRWFPKFPNASAITIDHLLSHTNGTFSFQQDLKLREKKGYHAPEELIAVAARHGSIFCPGERWLYSNTGYVFLARIIEEVEGRPYHEVATSRLIEPLGLRHTIALAPRQVPPGLVLGHVARKPDRDVDRSMPFGAGVIVATASDMVTFWHAVLSGRLVSRGTILQAYDKLYPMFDQPGLFYGRGVMLSEFRDQDGASHVWLGHSGGTPSAKAVIAWDASERVFIAVAFNGDVSAEAGANKLLAELKAYRGAAAEVRPWKPAGISSPRFESHAAFDPRTGDLYFVRSSPQFSGWRIFVSQCTDSGWSAPRPPAFAGDGVEADPWFTADGRTLYFISTRSRDGVKGKDLEIWTVERDDAGTWGAPSRLPEPVNSPGAEWFPRPGADGWLYFGSDRPGGLGATDIWRARADSTGSWTAENLGAAVNTAGDEYEPLPAPDGSRMIVMADGDLYETRNTPTGWAPRRKLGPEVNQKGMKVGPMFSPSGRSLLFARDTQGPDSGEFFVWYEHGHEAWPPSCPPRGR